MAIFVTFIHPWPWPWIMSYGKPSCVSLIGLNLQIKFVEIRKAVYGWTYIRTDKWTLRQALFVGLRGVDLKTIKICNQMKPGIGGLFCSCWGPDLDWMLFVTHLNQNWTFDSTTLCRMVKMFSTNLAVLANKLQERVDDPFEEVDDELSVVGGQDFWQSVDPRHHEWSPAECHRLQVDHSTAADCRWLITQHSTWCAFLKDKEWKPLTCQNKIIVKYKSKIDSL